MAPALRISAWSEHFHNSTLLNPYILVKNWILIKFIGHLNSRQIALYSDQHLNADLLSDIQMPVNVHYSNGVWNTRQFVCYLDHGLNTGPFNDQTGFNHLNTGLVQYSDPYWKFFCLQYRRCFYLIVRSSVNFIRHHLPKK